MTAVDEQFVPKLLLLRLWTHLEQNTTFLAHGLNLIRRSARFSGAVAHKLFLPALHLLTRHCWLPHTMSVGTRTGYGTPPNATRRV
jgi:hypothetical protein